MGTMVLAEETILSRMGPPLIMKFHCCKVIIICNHMGGSIPLNGGTPNGWFIMENPILKWMI